MLCISINASHNGADIDDQDDFHGKSTFMPIITAYIYEKRAVNE